MNIRVLLAIHRAMQAGLRTTLGLDPDISVVGDAADAYEAVRRSAELEPDVVLLDLHLPRSNGLGLARLLGQSGTPAVLLMCDRDETVSVREVIAAGCAGLLHKDLAERDVLEAVHCVHVGRVYLDMTMARRLTQPALSMQPLALKRLSPRERDVFVLIAAGHTNCSAGARLGLSAKTVEKHRASVMAKLRLRTALELRMMALELGLSSPDDFPQVMSAAPPVSLAQVHPAAPTL